MKNPSTKVRTGVGFTTHDNVRYPVFLSPLRLATDADRGEHSDREHRVVITGVKNCGSPSMPYGRPAVVEVHNP
jgi:hypothetical protein